MAELQVDVVAADQTIWSGSARSVVVPAVGGELGVLVGHEPLMAVLGTGRVRVTPTGDKSEPIAEDISGGFVSVDDDTVTIVIDTVLDTEA